MRTPRRWWIERAEVRLARRARRAMADYAEYAADPEAYKARTRRRHARNAKWARAVCLAALVLISWNLIRVSDPALEWWARALAAFNVVIWSWSFRMNYTVIAGFYEAAMPSPWPAPPCVLGANAGITNITDDDE